MNVKQLERDPGRMLRLHAVEAVLASIEPKTCLRDGLRDTPDRVVRSWNELFSGYKQDPAALFRTFQKGTYNQMVLLKDVELYSTCEHHLLPFVGKAHVAYLP